MGPKPIEPWDTEMQRNLIDAICYSGVIEFGRFVLPSEIGTNYFLNVGKMRDREFLEMEAAAFAGQIINSRIKSEIGKYDFILGPGCKKTPLSEATAKKLLSHYGLKKESEYNGTPPNGGNKVIIVYDELPVNKTEFLDSSDNNLKIVGIILALGNDYTGELEKELDIPVIPIIENTETLFNIMYREGRIDEKLHQKLMKSCKDNIMRA